MQRSRLIAFCVFSMLLLSVAGSGVVFSQPSDEIRQAFLQDMQKSGDEIRQFSESIQPLFADMGKDIQPKVMAAIMERMKDTSSPPTQEEMAKLGNEIVMDGFIGMQKPLNEKATEFLSEEGRQKMHLRMFQAKTSLMERLETSDNPDAIEMALRFDMMQLMGGQPDFLELSPEQRELITKQQKETSLEALTLTTQATLKMITTNPGRLAEIQQQVEAFQKAKTDEERTEIAKKLQTVNIDIYKDIAPKLKTILIKGHEDFLRVLTDAQKAKVKAVMADMPDYVKKLLAEVDKGGNALSGLDSWVPGMGVPGVNPNREAPRQRQSGERTFPGN